MEPKTTNIPTIEKEAASVEAMLMNPASEEDINRYFEETSAEMQEAATVVDRRLVKTSADFLTRNLVVACQSDPQAIDHMSDVYKEVIHNGSLMIGVDLAELEGERTPEEMLQDLQIALNGDIEMPIDLDPRVLSDLVGSLLFANQSLMSTKSNRDAITEYTSLRYYVDNIVAARSHLQPKI